MTRNANWTAKEDATMLVLRKMGRSRVDIGQRLGRTSEAVKTRLRWIKLSAERRAEIGRTRTRNRSSGAAA